MAKVIATLAMGLMLCGAAAVANPRGGALGGFDVVPAYGSVSYNVYLNGGEWTDIAVSGDGDTDLDLYVYDSNGNCIVRDTDYTDDCGVTVFPYRSGYFTIRVVNLGSVYNQFEIEVL